VRGTEANPGQRDALTRCSAGPLKLVTAYCYCLLKTTGLRLRRDPEWGEELNKSQQSSALWFFSFPLRLQMQAFDASGNEKSQAKMLGFSWSG
jgi:hypothetical protein